jgi:hypothetical protein
MRALLFILATAATAYAIYAIVSGVTGFVINAGLGVLVATTAWLVADIIAHRQRERMRQERERVWARREREQATMARTYGAGKAE